MHIGIALIFSSVAFILSAGVAGFLSASYLEMKEAKRLLEVKVQEFDDITRKASEANNSMATKILGLEERVNTLEFLKQSASPLSSPWKG